MFRILAFLALALQAAVVTITSPQPGGMVRGEVQVTGSMAVPDFARGELAFRYVEGPETWFLIQSFDQPPPDAVLSVWDTTSISDGAYNLRLQVVLRDGSIQEAQVTNVRVVNDLPPPTAVPTDPLPAVGDPLPTLFRTPIPSLSVDPPTPRPANPAALNRSAVISAFGRGVLIALLLFAGLSLLLRPRRT